MAPENEIEKLILKLSKGQQEIEQEDSRFYRKVERIETVGRLLWFIGAGIFCLGIWVANVQWRLAAVANELEARKVLVERVNELWWMKEHGMNNSDAVKPPRSNP